MSKRSLTPFVMLEASAVASAIAGGMTYVVLPWLTLELTGSALVAGLVVALEGVISFVMFPISGTFVDRIGRRRIGIVSHSLVALVSFGFALWALNVAPTMGMIVTLTIINAVFKPPGFTAQKSLVANTAELGQLPLERANGIHEGIRGLGWIAGPAAGSLLIAFVGPAGSFWFVGVGFVISVIAISSIRVGHTVGGQSDVETPRASFFTDTFEGFRALRADRALFLLLMFIVVVDAVYIPSEEIVLPYYFNEHHDPIGLGIVISSMVVGVTAGALIFEWLSRIFRTAALIRICTVGSCSVLLAMAVFPPVPLFAALGFVLAFIWGPINPLISTLTQRRFDAEIQGRVFGVQLAMFTMAPPVMLPFIGWLVGVYGPQPVYFVLVMVTFVLALGVMFMPIFNDFNRSIGPNARGRANETSTS